eukprot:CAMPEP_0177529974 /NCGR_PEP_ID=MMETSP0369-20130122/53124_1 /TAXON_ID=447022 ORGANISM="Scrippsiella hangoei-like, Strain SHHI-4" /NCGR_SAMPLE_ID=MMETSP0369 /ASSEMBLY_ACC=CAM_ASM_000364 /LENGTH=47 /DNA_ID= /DNA_START= /DNA_END= /DNA_ORIENTATION=
MVLHNAYHIEGPNSDKSALRVGGKHRLQEGKLSVSMCFEAHGPKATM